MKSWFSDGRQRISPFTLVRWVVPPSLLSMAPNRSMSPERTARVGICPEANQSLCRCEAHSENSTWSASQPLAFPNALKRR